MAYTIKGTYAAVCDCSLLCPCPVDGPPTGEGDQCHGLLVFDVREGNLNGTDLSGVAFALYNHFPSNLTSGNWKVGIVVDDGASDEQAQAIERIVSGEEGGPFGEFAPHSPSGSVAGVGDFGVDFVRGPDGSPTTVNNAMFGFAPAFKVGKGSGRFSVFGSGHEARYAEGADFEFSTQMAEGATHPRA